MSNSQSLKNLINQNFLEYASYVIKDRAIPFIEDGLKPVQRRILHTLFEVDDGKFHKVANVVGHTMRYHPHGDASIEAALVNMAQKNYFIDKQGNFGNIITGDPASAARYIECRLTPLAKDTLFNPEITLSEDSYDGRNQEPIYLPAKLPILLLSGVEGIAVGLSTRILPHNFRELLIAQIAILKDEPFEIFPDFQQGGVIDVTQYQKGFSKGRVRVRAKIEIKDPKTLVIRELPYGTTTETLIKSIEKAIHDGKIKVASINDFTTEHVEIELKVGHGSKAENVLPRLFLYTDCERSITLHSFVIQDQRPVEMDVHQILEANTEELLQTLEKELQCELRKLQTKERDLTLSALFIEHKIYQALEDASSLKALRDNLLEKLEPLTTEWESPITQAELDKLLNIPIRRISRYDSDKVEKELKALAREIKRVQKHLKKLKPYAIDYLEGILNKYGEMYPRRTRIQAFDTINAHEVAIQDIKVAYDKKTRYLGSEVKDDNYVTFSSYDKVLLFFKQGHYKVIDIPEKLYIKEKVLFFDRQANLKTFSVIYQDNDSGIYYMKRFKVKQFILDRDYEFMPPDAKLIFFSCEPDPYLKLEFAPKKRSRVTEQILDFGELRIKSVSAKGNQVTNREIVKIRKAKRLTPEEVAALAAEEAAQKAEQEAQQQAEAAEKAELAAKQLSMLDMLD